MSYERIPDEDWEIMRKISGDIFEKLMERGDTAFTQTSIEEMELRSMQAEQLELLEKKYGPHPWILDSKADQCEDPDEAIRLRIEGLSLVDEIEYELRAQFYYDLAKDYFYEKENKKEAKMWVDKAISLVNRIDDESLKEWILELENDLNA